MEKLSFQFWLIYSVSVLCVSVAEEDSCVWSGLRRSVDPKADSLAQLSNEFLQMKLKFNPIWASFRGFHQFDTFLPSFDEACFFDMRKACDVIIARVDGITEHQNLTQLNQIYLGTIKWECKIYQEGMAFKSFLFPPIGHSMGVQSGQSKMLNAEEFLYDFSNVTDLEKPLIRLKKLPKMFDDIIDLLALGMNTGITMARHNILKTIKLQFESLYKSNPKESSFYEPFARLPVDFGTEEVRRIQDEAKAFITRDLQPALRRLQDKVFKEYVNYARITDGILSVPNGKKLYQKCLEFHTSVEGITAEEIHDIGLEGVTELKEGVFNVMKTLSLNLTFGEFVQYVQNSPGQKFNSSEELLSYVTTMLKEDINPKLKEIFPAELLTEKVFDPLIQLVPPGRSGTAYYSGGSVDGKRSGSIFLGLKNIEAFKKFELRALIMHEANPGHNMHTEFRTHHDFPPHLAFTVYSRLNAAPSNFPYYTSFSEGWSLYSEWLGIELDLFQDPFDLLGFYSWNLLRASRLVVDTGIHHFGWTRDKSVEYILQNTFLSQTVAESQVDRYIDWPGQATSYKIGERYIKQMRRKYEARFSEQLSVPEFHRRVLACQVPFSQFEGCLQVLDEMQGFPIKGSKKTPSAAVGMHPISPVILGMLIVQCLCSYAS